MGRGANRLLDSKHKTNIRWVHEVKEIINQYQCRSCQSDLEGHISIAKKTKNEWYCWSGQKCRNTG